jgi:hypothetical protein
MPPAPLNRLASQYYLSLKPPKPGMVCAARMKVAPYTVFYGKAGHGIKKKALAGGLGDKLRSPPAVTGQGWDSDNCAEVHAAHSILKSLKVAFGHTGGVEFYSVDSKGAFREPCLNCKVWIKGL